jgi:hypothetical protein
VPKAVATWPSLKKPDRSNHTITENEITSTKTSPKTMSELRMKICTQHMVLKAVPTAAQTLTISVRPSDSGVWFTARIAAPNTTNLRYGEATTSWIARWKLAGVEKGGIRKTQPRIIPTRPPKTV